MKKLISLLLSLIMMMTLTALPLTSFAEEAAAQKEEPVTASSIKLDKKSINTVFYGESYFNPVKLKLSVSFPENAKKCKDVITVKSSNPKVAKCSENKYYFSRNKNKKIECTVYGLGTTTLTFTSKSGLKAKCKINVNKLYAIQLTGKKTVSYFKINGKKTTSWKSSDSRVIKAKKAGFVCLKRSDKPVILSKKLKGKTYKVYVMPQTKKDLENLTKKQLLKDYKSDKKEEEWVRKSKYKFGKVKTGYYSWVRTYEKDNVWESGMIMYTPKGIISVGMSR